MTSSKHLQVRDAVADAIEALPLFAGAKVVRNGRRPVPQGTQARVFVFLSNAASTPFAIRGAPVNWITGVRVELVARDVPGTEAESAVDQLLQQVYARLESQPSLGGLAMDLNVTNLEWGEDEADTTVASCSLSVQVQHRTGTATLN